MAHIAWYGTGYMGAAFSEALLERGDTVRVWNRTTEKAEPLAALGALVETDPGRAASGADRIHLTLADDAAVDALLDRIIDRIPAGAILIDHSTVTPMGTVARAQRLSAHGIAFLSAPMFMAPAAARNAGGTMIVAGPAAIFKRVETELKKMTGNLWYVGERIDRAAIYKLNGNMLLFFIVAGLADVYALAAGCGMSAVDAHALFSQWKPQVAIDNRGKNMAAGDFRSSFDLVMARKDLRLALETAAATGAKLDIAPAILARMDEVIAAGHAHDDLGVLAYESAPAPLN